MQLKLGSPYMSCVYRIYTKKLAIRKSGKDGIITKTREVLKAVVER
jgi:hypothetical protein